MTQLGLMILIGISATGIGLAFWVLFKKTTSSQQQSQTFFKNLEDHVLKLERTIFDTTHQLHGHQKEIANHLLNQQTQSTKVFGEVQSSLGKVHQLTTQFSHIGQELSSLQRLFEIPKRRGIFGEELLKKLLGDILPSERYQIQYRVGPDTVVDAVILFSDRRYLCIDAKFPMPAYQQYLEAPDEQKTALLKQLVRDMKRHIVAIADRYIRPDIGTLPFALMYIPAESIYYDIFVAQIDTELEQPTKHYAFEKKVYPVSPNTLYMFLHQVCTTFRHEMSEQRIWEVMDRVNALGNQLQKIREHSEGIKRYLDYAQKRMNDLDSSITRFTKDIEQIELYQTQPELTRRGVKGKKKESVPEVTAVQPESLPTPE